MEILDRWMEIAVVAALFGSRVAETPSDEINMPHNGSNMFHVAK
jgi:hypothetical protein